MDQTQKTFSEARDGSSKVFYILKRCNVGDDRIDASLGLAFSLALFERYQKNGLLQAELHHIPGFRGRCVGYLHLVGGKVTSCHVEDKQGQRYSMSKNLLIRIDSERGPFEWILTAQPARLAPEPHPELSPQSLLNSPTPRRIASLHLDLLEGWTTRQKLMLSLVFDVIDGKRTIEDIKGDTPLPSNIVEEALQVLWSMKVIVFF